MGILDSGGPGWRGFGVCGWALPAGNGTTRGSFGGLRSRWDQDTERELGEVMHNFIFRAVLHLGLVP